MTTTKLSYLLLFSACVLLHSLSQAATSRQSGIERRQLVLPASDFTEPSIRGEFLRSLSQRTDNTGILLIDAVDNLKFGNLSEMGIDDATYGSWRGLYSDYENGIPPFAELLAIGQNAAMRLRDNSGRVSLSVLEGQNPYDVRACGQYFSLAHLAVRHQANMISTFSDGLHFFLITTGTINEELTRCAREELQSSAPKMNVSVSIRNDRWFLLDPDYPVVLPFITDNSPPTEQDYERATYWECEPIKSRVICSGGPAHGPANVPPKSK